MNEYNISVLGKIFTAVESGGQIYGKGRWDDVTLPHFGNEKTLTLGAYQFGGGSNEGRDLLRLIRERYPKTFAKYDTCGIAATLDIDWYSTGFIGSEAQRAAIKAMIAAPDGITCQTIMFGEVQLPAYLKHAYAYGIPAENIPALMMWAEIDHLGGSKAPVRVFNRCNGDFTVDKILSALLPKYADYTKYKCPVEDSIFRTRHVKCSEFVKQYAQYPEEDAESKESEESEEESIMSYSIQKLFDVAFAEVGYMEKESNKYLDSKTANAGDNNYTKYGRDMLATVPEYGDCYGINYQWCDQFVDWCFVQAFGKEGAKYLLVDWSAYTPTSAGYFKKIGRYDKTPSIGAVIFFRNSTRICHTGIVYDYDDTYVYTVEGNTSNGVSVVSNGGMVCKKKYLRTNARIDGYGHPHYGVDTTASNGGSVRSGQHFLNAYYSDVVKASIGHLLKEDNDFDVDTYRACLAVWKDVANRLYGANLTITNHNFGNSCKEAARKMAVSKGREGTLVWIYETMLSAYGFYMDSMDGAFGNNMDKAVREFQEAAGLKVDGSLGSDSVYALFNYKTFS